MPRATQRPTVPATHWEQQRLQFAWPEQVAYELIRPIVAFGQSTMERARETGVSRRTLTRKVRRFDQAGMRSLFPPPAPTTSTPPRPVPPLLRRAALCASSRLNTRP